jgi:2-oxoglutarate ferredoxin oxidoreductase subunit delta
VSPRAKTGYWVRVNHSYCTGCSNCIQFCPQHVLAKDEKLNKRGIYAPVAVAIEKCTGCDICELYCGNFAISVGARPVAVEEGVA